MLAKIIVGLYWLDNQPWFWTVVGLINLIAMYGQMMTNQTVGRILISFAMFVFCVFQVNRTVRKKK